MDFKGPARPLAFEDVEAIAGYLGCEIAAVRAVLAVESRGSGFAKDGRPIILCEPHILYRQLNRKRSKRTEAVNAGLAYSRWGSKPYPRTQSARYKWLAKAMKVDEDAALKSCSWGLGQVMGFNHKLCGYPTVQDFVYAMMESEGAQLYAVARFCVSNSLQRYLRRKDWRKFARGYNGASYAKHGYHTKLASAYRRRPAAEKVTPPPPPDYVMQEVAGMQIPPVGARAIKESRTVKASMGQMLVGGGAAAPAAAGVGDAVYGLMSSGDEAEAYLSRGDVLGLVMGGLVMGLAAYIAWVRWDDAGRPSMRSIFGGSDVRSDTVHLGGD